MNKIFIVGNVVREPDMRTTKSGALVCNFDVAVDRRGKNKDEADFFKVTAWKNLGEICGKYVHKGRKVCVIGSVSVEAYLSSSGEARATMNVTADEIDFFTVKGDNETPEVQDTQREKAYQKPKVAEEEGFIAVDEDELPF